MEKIKVDNKKVIYHDDLIALIKGFYNIDYSFDKDSLFKIDIGNVKIEACKDWLEDDEKEDIEIFKNGGEYMYILWSLIHDLCDNDLIDEGQYLLTY